jgi:hypothetical protein
VVSTDDRNTSGILGVVLSSSVETTAARPRSFPASPTPGRSSDVAVARDHLSAVYQPASALAQPSRLAPHHRSPLRTERDHRRAHQRSERRWRTFEQPMLTTSDPSNPTIALKLAIWESQ